jgi:hypothetical protein
MLSWRAYLPQRRSSESGAAIFTGTYFGMYAAGNSQPCQTPADLDQFEYENLEAY